MVYRLADERKLEKRAAWRAASAGKRFQLFNIELGGFVCERSTTPPPRIVPCVPRLPTRQDGAGRVLRSIRALDACCDTPGVVSVWPLPALQRSLDEQGRLLKRRRLAHLNAECTNGAQLPPNSGGRQEKNTRGSLMLSVRPPPSMPNGW